MIYSIGEALIDIYNFGPRQGKNAGGASANFAASAAALGGKSVLITALGDDADGAFLLQSLKNAGVITDYITVIPGGKMGAVAICGDRSGSALCALRREAADMQLAPGSIPDNLFKKGDTLHFCSMSLLESPMKYATLKALEAASNAGSTVILDINYRPGQWGGAAECVKALSEVLPYANYVKGTASELKALFPGGNATGTLFALGKRLKCVIVTAGEDRISAYFKDKSRLFVQPFPVEAGTSAAGAGDCFTGAFICCMEGLKALHIRDLEEYKQCVEESLTFAAAAAASSINSDKPFYAPDPGEIEKRLRGAQPK